MIKNKHIIKIKELICEDVDMGTYGLVELELFEMEKEFEKRIAKLKSILVWYSDNPLIDEIESQYDLELQEED